MLITLRYDAVNIAEPLILLRVFHIAASGLRYKKCFLPLHCSRRVAPRALQVLYTLRRALLMRFFLDGAVDAATPLMSFRARFADIDSFMLAVFERHFISIRFSPAADASRATAAGEYVASYIPE